MRIAVVGSGIAGLASAYLLGSEHDVTLFEKEERLGGHTHTHDVVVGGKRLAVDTGFIVFNETNYPCFTRLLRELGIGSSETTMSFSVQNERTGLEYGATDLQSLFCQRRNLVSPSFFRMLVDLVRFYRDAKAMLASDARATTLGEFVRSHGYGTTFVESHLVPMASALWSAPETNVLELPMEFVARFMDNHRMLDLRERPTWRVVDGGSSRYIDSIVRSSHAEVRSGSAVTRVSRAPSGVGVDVEVNGRLEHFDHVVLACHSDQALALLDAPTPNEKALLGATTYQENRVVLHTDRSLLPSRREAWSAWNALVPRDRNAPCSVSYYMNALQGIDSPQPVIVTLNGGDAIDPAHVLARVTYHHPVFSHDGVAAQARVHEIDGVDRISYAGAYWGYGFHEDGVRSAVRVATRLGVPWH
jgi:predicted NAD/FAD-binding protein